MASYDNALYTEQIATAKSMPSTSFEDVNFLRVLITIPSGISASDTINVMNLPLGAKVRPGLSKIISDGAGSGVTVTLGDAADADRYVVTEDVSTAGLTDFIHSSTLPASALTPYVVEEANKTLVLTVAGMSSWAEGSELVLELAVDRG